LKAERVEDSTIWNRYSFFKLKLQEKLSDSGRTAFPSMAEFDIGRHSHTHNLLAGVENVEDCLSLENVHAELNEMLLWHTSEEAAQSIVATDFQIPKDKSERLHGKRFGAGAYFAEDSVKSLSYTKGEKRFMLLCRVTCGDFFYTEKSSFTDATDIAQAEGKHCVLANPKESTFSKALEFVIWDTAQVYPEYVLEVELKKE